TMRAGMRRWKIGGWPAPGGLRRFAADRSGVSAIEFAILLPLMLTLYFGGVEVSQAVSADRKNTLVAHTVGDLVSQSTNVTCCNSTDDVTNIFNAAQWVIYPFGRNNPKSAVSRVRSDSTDTISTLAWW